MARDAFGRFSRGISAAGVLGALSALKGVPTSTEMKHALEDVGEVIVQDIQQMMEESGDPPSQPGEAPAIDTGLLYESYRYTVEKIDGKLELQVGSDLQYAGFLEFGTVNMQPRPHLGPGMEIGVREAQQVIVDGFVAALRTALHGLPSEILL